MTLQLKETFLQEINDGILTENGVRLFVKRDDLIHPYVSGNKWRKLKYNIAELLRLRKKYLLTFGGAFSNHIIATAAAGKEYGIKTIGVIRGEELNTNSNAALQFATACGMKLIFVSREVYKTLHDSKRIQSFIDSTKLDTSHSELYILPEGGFNELAVKGCEEIMDEISIPFDYICCPCGTGATLSGIARKLTSNQQAIGFSVLCGENFLEKQVSQFAGRNYNWSINFDYHFDGYGKSTIELKEFCKEFSETNNILIEPIYTGKMFFGIYDLVKKDFFKRGSVIVAIHTGGTAFEEK